MIAVGGLLTASLAGAQQRNNRTVVIGWLGSGRTSSSFLPIVAVLRDQGFAATVQSRFAEGNLERLPGLASELVSLNPHLIITSDAVSTGAARGATTTIPIVMAGASDPLRLGFIQSFARPGGNVTGLSSPFGDQFATKWVELLRAVVPDADRVALLWNPEIPAARLRQEQIRRVAGAAGLELVSLEVRRTEDFEHAFKQFRQSRAAGIIVDNAPFISARALSIHNFVTAARIPSIWGFRASAEAGGLISYGIDYSRVYERVGHYAAKILRGAKPADMPVEQPDRYELIVNLKTAKALGLNIPQSVLLRADRVIE